LSPSRRLQTNLRKLLQTEEGYLALEDAVVAWEANTGHMPTEEELERITTLLLRFRSSWWTFWYYVTVAAMLFFVGALVYRCFIVGFN
jgi:hypothetical protein